MMLVVIYIIVLISTIKYGKEYGYTFKAITEDTPSVVHGVNN